MLGDAPHLDGSYAAFGKVISGMDVVHAIEEAGNRVSPIIIEMMSVETSGVAYPGPEIIE